MIPINQVPQDDVHKYMFQDQPIIVNPAAHNPKQKFSLEQSKKKKVDGKEPSPWLPKKPKKEAEDLET